MIVGQDHGLAHDFIPCAQIKAAAGKHLSDVITVKTPNAKVAAPSEPAKVAPKKATSKSSFRNDLLLADSDDD